MRLAIDSSFLVLNRASGLRTYTLNLVRALLREAPGDEIVCFYSYFRAPCPRPALPGAQVRVCRVPRRLLEAGWGRLGLPPVDWLTGRVDVFHSVHLLVPPQSRGGTVLTVHDLREFRLPHLFPHLQDLREARSRMARRAHRVVVISESTRRDAIELLGLEEERVRVVPNGLDPRFLLPADPGAAAAMRQEMGLVRPYVLFLSSRDPRKALPDACRAFREACRGDLAGLDLVVAGDLPAGAADSLREAGPRERVRAVGTVSDEAIPALLAEAEVLLFPSLYEGFGLPVLEAMACGTPVVACDVSSIPEVAGDAALLVPPGDVSALGEGLVRLITDGSLRELLRSRGRERCLRYTWRAAARGVLDVYREAAREAS